MSRGRTFGHMLMAAAFGSVVGSALIGLLLSIAVTDKLPFRPVSGALGVALFGTVIAFLPVLVATILLGSVALALARRSDPKRARTRYLVVTTVGVTLPWLLVPENGLIGAAGTLLSYGYPTAAMLWWLERADQ